MTNAAVIHNQHCDVADDHLQRAQRNLFEAIPLRIADKDNDALRVAYQDLLHIRTLIQGVRDRLQKAREL